MDARRQLGVGLVLAIVLVGSALMFVLILPTGSTQPEASCQLLVQPADLRFSVDLRLTSTAGPLAIAGTYALEGPTDSVLLTPRREANWESCLPYFMDRPQLFIENEAFRFLSSWESQLRDEISNFGFWSLARLDRTLDIRGPEVNNEGSGGVVGLENLRVPWHVSITLDGPEWPPGAVPSPIPSALTNTSVEWQLNEPVEIRATAEISSLAAAYAAFDTQTIARARTLSSHLISGLGGVIAAVFAFRMRTRHAEASLLILLLCVSLGFGWFTADGIQVLPEGSQFLNYGGYLVLIFAFVFSGWLVSTRFRPMIIFGAIFASLMAAATWVFGQSAFIANDRAAEVVEAGRTTTAAVMVAISAVVASVILGAWVQAHIQGDATRSLLNSWALTTIWWIAVAVIAILSLWQITFEWSDARNFALQSVESGGGSPRTSVSSILLAFHPSAIATIPPLVSLLGALTIFALLDDIASTEEAASRFSTRVRWLVAALFALTVVGTGNRYLGFSLPIALIPLFALSRMLSRPKFPERLRKLGVDMAAFLAQRRGLIRRALEVERLHSLQRETLKHLSSGQSNPLQSSRLMADLKYRYENVGKYGTGSQLEHITLDRPEEAGELIFQIGPKPSWWTNGLICLRLGAYLAVLPLAYFFIVLIIDVRSRGGQVPLSFILSTREVFFWLGAAFVLGATASHLPMTKHLTKGFVLTAVFALATGIDALLQRWLGSGVGSNWLFEVSQLGLYLGVVGAAMDIHVLNESGFSWRNLFDLYQLNRMGGVIAYVGPVALAAITVGQQIASGAGEDAIRALIENASAILP